MPDEPASAVVVVAHPDDAEFQCGATLARWSRTGTVVHHLVLTDGSKGTWDASVDRAQLAALRQAEQRSAAAALGCTGEVVFLGREDGELASDPATRRDVAAVLRRLRPSVVLGHDPWKRYRLHPDHAAAGRVLVEAVVAARDPLFLPELLDEGLEPHRPDAMLLFEADEVNHAEPVEAADVEARIAALERHASQVETTHLYRIEAAGRHEALEHFRQHQREHLAAIGRRHGHAFAEEYHLVTDQL